MGISSEERFCCCHSFLHPMWVWDGASLHVNAFQTAPSDGTSRTESLMFWWECTSSQWKFDSNQWRQDWKCSFSWQNQLLLGCCPKKVFITKDCTPPP